MCKKFDILSVYFELSLIIISLFLFTGCIQWPDESIDKQACSIVGIVSDVTTNASIPAVKVSIQSEDETTEESIVTGNDGVYRFENLKSGDYCLTFVKDGYKAIAEKISVNDRLTFDVAMERMPAEMISDKDVLDFGDKMSSLSFSIVNRSYWDLNWELVRPADNSWITSVVPSRGTLGYGKTETIVVSIDRSQLLDGENETMLNIRSSGDGGVGVKVIAYKKPYQLATVNINSVYDINPTSASFLAEVTHSGFPEYYECGFVCGTIQQQTLETADLILSCSKRPDLTFSATATGLVLGEDYYVRAYIKNDAGVSYSDEFDFQTKPRLPELSILDVTSLDLQNRTAVFNAVILYDGDPKYNERGFVYSCDNITPTMYDNVIVYNGGSQDDFSLKASDLQVEKFYYVRAYAKSDGGISYSPSTEKFSTEQSYPSVMTMGCSELDIVNASVRLYGKVLDVGIPSYTEKGFVYSDSNSSPTIEDSQAIVQGGGDGVYTTVLTGLPNASYHYRAFVINNKGVVYGESMLFEL